MSKVFTADEVKKHNTNNSVWIVIRNDVYDVSAFLEEHPGGEDPLLEAGGQDATIAFDDVGHSADARGMLKKYKIGSLAPGQGCTSFQSDEKPWLRYSPPVSRSPSTKSMKSNYKVPVSPRAERRVQQIIVPIEPSSKLKWALLALGLAVILGVAYKKFSK